jgi:inosine/xanthosine triphosphatase
LTSPADHIIIGIEVESGVSAQPFSAEETLLGARLRSKALQSIVKNTSKDDICAKLGLSNGFEQYYTVGVEGGIEKVADLWLESGYIVIVNEKGIECVGTSARFQLAEFVIEDLNTGKELCEVVEVLSGLSDVRSKQGYMGMITNDLLGRVRAYIHGVLFAFAKFHSPPQYWDETR